MRTIVVLPAPFGPSNAKIVPTPTVRSTWLSTIDSPNDLHTRDAAIAILGAVLMISCSVRHEPTRDEC